MQYTIKDSAAAGWLETLFIAQFNANEGISKPSYGPILKQLDLLSVPLWVQNSVAAIATTQNYYKGRSHLINLLNEKGIQLSDTLKNHFLNF